MSTNEPTVDSDGGGPPESALPSPDSPWAAITDLQVASGRVMIPSRPRERHGIGEGDVLEVYLRTDDGQEIHIDEALVGSQHRLLIPSHRRQLHDLEGRYVDMAFRDTGTDYDGGE